MQKCADGRVGSRSQVPVRADAAVGPLFNHPDLQRALDALDFVFQDEEMPPGDLRLRQSRLLARLHERGISHTLGLALIEDLLTRGVFHAGKSFYNLKVFVRLDGQQADRATADRYLHTTRERWWSYLAQKNAHGEPFVVRTGRQRTPIQRDRKLEARDRWLYQKCYKGIAHKTIKSDLGVRCQKKGWRMIHSIQGIRWAAGNYARRHALPMPASRQNL